MSISLREKKSLCKSLAFVAILPPPPLYYNFFLCYPCKIPESHKTCRPCVLLFTIASPTGKSLNFDLQLHKVVQIWPGQTVTCLHTNRPGHIWPTLYFHREPFYRSTPLLYSRSGLHCAYYEITGSPNHDSKSNISWKNTCYSKWWCKTIRNKYK
jgi:hypothetical protein